MANVRYKKNYKGIGEMLNEDWMVADMEARAHRIMAAAVADAPEETGAYKTKFEASAGKRGGFRGDRAYGRVKNTDKAAFSIEVGTAKTPAHWTLTKALLAGGG